MLLTDNDVVAGFQPLEPYLAQFFLIVSHIPLSVGRLGKCSLSLMWHIEQKYFIFCMEIDSLRKKFFIWINIFNVSNESW